MTVIRWLIARLACAQSLLIWSAAITRAAAPRATSLPGRRRIPAIVPGAGGEARFRAEPCPPAQSAPEVRADQARAGPPAQSARRNARNRGVTRAREAFWIAPRRLSWRSGLGGRCPWRGRR